MIKIYLLVFILFLYNTTIAQPTCKSDSIDAGNIVEKLLLANDKSVVEMICKELDQLKYLKYLKANSKVILKYVSKYYKESSECSELLSLIELPKYLRDSILTNKSISSLAKARLGDTSSINFFLKKYEDEKNKNDEQINIKSLENDIKLLLSLNNTRIEKILMSDFNSSRIIKRNESLANGIYMEVDYSIQFFIIKQLRQKYRNESIFDEKYLFPFFDAEDKSLLNKNINTLYVELEDFVRRVYGVNVNIKAPFIIIGWPIDGYF